MIVLMSLLVTLLFDYIVARILLQLFVLISTRALIDNNLKKDWLTLGVLIFLQQNELQDILDNTSKSWRKQNKKYTKKTSTCSLQQNK